MEMQNRPNIGRKFSNYQNNDQMEFVTDDIRSNNSNNSAGNESEIQSKASYKMGFKGMSKLNQEDLTKVDPITFSCEIDKDGININTKGVEMKVDNEGVTDYKTGVKNQQILPNDVEYFHELGAGNGGVVRYAVHK